jgi:hypothetical protein
MALSFVTAIRWLEAGGLTHEEANDIMLNRWPDLFRDLDGDSDIDEDDWREALGSHSDWIKDLLVGLLDGTIREPYGVPHSLPTDQRDYFIRLNRSIIVNQWIIRQNLQ